MWLSTTHGVIRAYRAQVGFAEERVRAVGGDPRAGASASASVAGRTAGRTRRRKDRHGGAGEEDGDKDEALAELRKVSHRFRAFLAGEIDAYKAFIGDFVRVFGLASAGEKSESAVQGWLKAAGVSLAVDNPLPIAQTSDGSSADDAAATPSTAPAVVPAPHALSPEERAKKVGLVHKALICLGDLERYKEQYGEEKARSAPRHAAAGERYAAAKRYYEVARGLMPENGGCFGV